MRFSLGHYSVLRGYNQRFTSGVISEILAQILTMDIQLETKVTKALILAAGLGSRLNGSKKPKPLKSLLGLPLLARTILTLQKAGITDFYIVIGFQGERIRKGIEKSLKKRQLNLHWLMNDQWELPNGHSVLCAKDIIDSEFILTMSDHLFASDTVAKLVQNYSDKGGDLHLAVDFNPASYHDVDDATKVAVEDGLIVNIGKQIDNYNAYDTGLFIATPKLFEALSSVQKERVELSDGVRALSANKKAHVVDIEGNLWFDIDLPREFRMGRRLLLRSLKKPTDGLVSRYLNRPISLFMTRFLAPTCISPNMMTIVTFALAVWCSYLAVLGGYWNFLWAGILFQLTSIMDGVDGELARLKFNSSQFGAWMDTVFDNLSYVLALLGLTIGCYRSAEIPDFYHQIGFGGFIFGLIIFPIFYFYLKKNKRAASMLDVDYGLERMGPVSRNIFKVLYLFGKRDLFALIFLFFAIFGVFEFSILYAAGLLVAMIFSASRAYFVAATK